MERPATLKIYISSEASESELTDIVQEAEKYGSLRMGDPMCLMVKDDRKYWEIREKLLGFKNIIRMEEELDD